jgi:hypothetical protein
MNQPLSGGLRDARALLICDLDRLFGGCFGRAISIDRIVLSDDIPCDVFKSRAYYRLHMCNHSIWRCREPYSATTDRARDHENNCD